MLLLSLQDIITLQPGLPERSFKQALHDIIDDHTVLSYTPGIWDAVKTTDDRDDGNVWDMYSDNPSGANPYNYTFVTDQCGNYGAGRRLLQQGTLLPQKLV